jgi:hypothetical protein
MTAEKITTQELKAGDVIEHRRNGEIFTVDTVTTCKRDHRFHAPGDKFSESGMDIVGHDASGRPVNYIAAQSCPWWVVELAAR